MSKLYENANDQHIRTVFVYGDSTDSKLYDKASGTGKNQIEQAYLEDLFAKQMVLVVIGDKTYAPLYIDGNEVGVAAGVSNAIVEYAAKATE